MTSRSVSTIDMPLRGIIINETTDSGAVNVEAYDSGIFFLNEYAGTTTYTLPATSECKGKLFVFLANVGQNIAITAGTAATLSANGQTGYDTVTSGGTIGDWGMIIGDGSYVYFLAGQGTWTAST